MHSRDDARGTTLTGRIRAAGVAPVALYLAAAGVLLLLAAFTVLPWFRSGTGFFAGAGAHSSFSELHDLLARTSRQAQTQGLGGRVSFGASRAYFDWLGWLLFAVAAALCGFAVSRVGARTWAVHWLGAVAAATGAAVTLLALNLVTFEGNAPNNADAPTFGDFFSNSGAGAWTAVLGFATLGAASLVRSAIHR